MHMDSNNKTKQSRVWLRFSSMGLQMGLTIYFAHLIGVWLDQNYPSTTFTYDKVLTLLAVFGSTYSIIRQVIKMSNEDDAK
jgi:NO-binding membrane sensor protein with MHYT domain